MTVLYPSVSLTKEEIDVCLKFAEDVIETNIEHYRKRGQSNPENIKKQISVGKMGELACHKALGTSYPDFTVYDKKKKSFEQDMMVNGWNVHVKSQDRESAKTYGTSWTFQYNGNGGWGHTDPLISKPKPNDVVVMLTVDKKTGECNIHAIVKASDLMPCLSLPKLIQLYNSKRVVYAESIPENVLMDYKFIRDNAYENESGDTQLQQSESSEAVS